MRLYLASTSPARLATLRAAGIDPLVVPSHVDEPQAVAAAEEAGGPLDTASMVQVLARAKAEAVADTLADEPADALLLGGDSAFELDGVTYGKPHTATVARDRWLIQRGRTGRLFSGLHLIDLRTDGRASRPAAGAVSVASVTFAADITDDEIDAYIATGEPLKVAGAFTIDSLGGPFVTSITGDPSTVVGLPLPLMRRMVRELGVEWPSLWQSSEN